MPAWLRRLLWFAAAAALVFAVGFYRQGIQAAEGVHFALNYPATGTEVGGLGAMGKTGKLVVNIDNAGLIKKVTQPNVVNLSTHWLRNVGDTPRRVRLELEGFKYPVRWESTEKTWNEADRSIGRALAPGSSATVDWYVTFPRPLPADDVLVDGAVVVYDADSGQKLSRMPIQIVRATGVAAIGGD